MVAENLSLTFQTGDGLLHARKDVCQPTLQSWFLRIAAAEIRRSIRKYGLATDGRSNGEMQLTRVLCREPNVKSVRFWRASRADGSPRLSTRHKPRPKLRRVRRICDAFRMFARSTSGDVCRPRDHGEGAQPYVASGPDSGLDASGTGRAAGPIGVGWLS